LRIPLTFLEESHQPKASLSFSPQKKLGSLLGILLELRFWVQILVYGFNNNCILVRSTNALSGDEKIYGRLTWEYKVRI